MPKWEHRVIRADWWQSGVHAIRPEGKPTLPLEAYLNQAGDDGWEVVGMQALATIPDTGKLIIILKRPKPS